MVREYIEDETSTDLNSCSSSRSDVDMMHSEVWARSHTTIKEALVGEKEGYQVGDFTRLHSYHPFKASKQGDGTRGARAACYEEIAVRREYTTRKLTEDISLSVEREFPSYIRKDTLRNAD